MAQEPCSVPAPPHVQDSRSHSVTHTTVGRTPLDEWSARRSDRNLTTQGTHKRQTSMTPAGFEPTIPAVERLQTHTLDHAVLPEYRL